jgi:two-component system heavy metal sensor histidine kinase CusS
VLAVGLGSWLVVGRTLSPIRALSRQAAAASANDAETRLVPPSQDLEMSELVSTLNGFLDRIRDASEEKARFYAAASHELRTPLQALSGHLEVALAQPRTADDYQATVQEALVQTHRLVSLVEAILLLHQLQSTVHAVPGPVCLSAEIEDQIQSIQPLLEARQLRLRVCIEPEVIVPSIPMHVSVLVRNLLENAAKYSVESGDLNVSLAVSSGRAAFRIENQVGALSIDRARLYEPFYRLDASRSARSGGNGLGLAICRAVANANGWNLNIDLERSAVVANVEFPAAQWA